MAQSGAKIDENVGRGERSQADHVEDMARRGGLIKDDLRLSLNVSGVGLFELEHATDQLIEVVIAHAVGWAGCFFHLDPPKQSGRFGSALNFRSNGLVEVRVRSLESGANRLSSEIEGCLVRLCAGFLGVRETQVWEIRIREMSVKAVQRFQSLAKLIRLEERWLIFQLRDKALQRIYQ